MSAPSPSPQPPAEKADAGPAPQQKFTERKVAAVSDPMHTLWFDLGGASNGLDGPVQEVTLPTELRGREARLIYAFGDKERVLGEFDRKTGTCELGNPEHYDRWQKQPLTVWMAALAPEDRNSCPEMYLYRFARVQFAHDSPALDPRRKYPVQVERAVAWERRRVYSTEPPQPHAVMLQRKQENDLNARKPPVERNPPDNIGAEWTKEIWWTVCYPRHRVPIVPSVDAVDSRLRVAERRLQVTGRAGWKAARVVNSHLDQVASVTNVPSDEEMEEQGLSEEQQALEKRRVPYMLVPLDLPANSVTFLECDGAPPAAPLRYRYTEVVSEQSA